MIKKAKGLESRGRFDKIIEELREEKLNREKEHIIE